MSIANTIKRGQAGELLVKAKLLDKGFNLFTAVTEDSENDLIVEGKEVRHLYKCQIKRITSDTNSPALKLSNKIHKYYYHFNVDVFIAVHNESIYFVPKSFAINYTSSISLSQIEQFKDNYDVFK